MKLTVIVFYHQPQPDHGGKNVVRYDEVSILTASQLSKQLVLMNNLGLETKVNLEEVNALQIIPRLEPTKKE